MEPLISVIVPIYNIVEYLENCVNSILGQSYGNIEVLLIDDGSTDGCGELCDAFARRDRRVRVIHQQNAGIGAARNRGLKEAKGEYLAFVDGDDLLKRKYLEVLVSAARKYACEIAICSYLDKEGECLKKAPGRFEACAVVKGKNACFARYYEVTSSGNHVYGTVWAKLLRRSAVGDLRFDKRFRLGEDIAYMYQCYARELSVVEVPFEGYIYVERPGSAMRGGVRDFIVEALPSWKVRIRETRTCAPAIRKLVARDYGFMLYAAVSQLIRSGDYAKYRKKTGWLKRCCGKAFRLGALGRKHYGMLKLFCFAPGLYWRIGRIVFQAKASCGRAAKSGDAARKYCPRTYEAVQDYRFVR